MDSKQDFSCFESLSYPVIAIDGHQSILWANRTFLNLHQRSTLPTQAEEKKKFNEIFFAQYHKGIYSFEKYKTSVRYEVITSKLHTEKDIYLLSLFDVSKQKVPKGKVDRKDLMFRHFGEELPNGMLLFRDKILYSNPAFEKFVKYPGKELQKISFFDLIHSSAKDEFLQALQVPMRKKNHAFESIIQLITKSGNLVWAKVKTKVIDFESQETYLSVVSNMVKEQTQIEKLHELAYFDTLTMIYNRRKFNEVLSEEYQRSKRYKHSLAALFFDIDHFKKVNDTYGHDCGDDVLKSMAQVIKGQVRSSDCFARWGGEEFIILLPETTLENALKMAENLRSCIETTQFDKVPQVTISLGVTVCKHTERINSFLKRLDTALYEAKSAGRNRVQAL